MPLYKNPRTPKPVILILILRQGLKYPGLRRSFELESHLTIFAFVLCSFEFIFKKSLSGPCRGDFLRPFP